jgi:predicted GNAT family N-acyltransferase
MQIKIFQHNSNEYEQMVELRMEVLRRPLGISFTPEQLAKEKEDVLVGAFENNEIMGCCILTHNTKDMLQLRQMAVSTSVQHKGTGRAIIDFAEKWAREKGYSIVTMHARNVAIGFYEKCGYKTYGEEFTEVGIPHHRMEKNLLH